MCSRCPSNPIKKMETHLRDTFTHLCNISLFLLKTGATVCRTICSPPTLSRSIITIDCKVSLKKLGQSNLVHCPQKLKLPPTPDSGSSYVPRARMNHITNQAKKKKNWTSYNRFRIKPSQITDTLEDLCGCSPRPMAECV